MIENGKNIRIVLEAEEGILFRIQEEAEQVVIKAIKEYIPHIYSGDYTNPIIPEGFVHTEGTWDTGLVIKNTVDESEFVWIPVSWLDFDGTLDGKHFAEKLGRRNFDDSIFSESKYHEEVNEEFLDSVQRYGGFYFARFHASRENGNLIFRKGEKPWTNIDYPYAKEVVEDYLKDNETVASILPNGAAFDSVLSWLIKSGAKTFEEIAKDATSWGNFKDSSGINLQLTGSNENWCANNIYDIAGNVEEWTSEEFSNSKSWTTRGGCYFDDENSGCPAKRCNFGSYSESHARSFRAILYLKDIYRF